MPPKPFQPFSPVWSHLPEFFLNARLLQGLPGGYPSSVDASPGTQHPSSRRDHAAHTAVTPLHQSQFPSPAGRPGTILWFQCLSVPPPAESPQGRAQQRARQFARVRSSSLAAGLARPYCDLLGQNSVDCLEFLLPRPLPLPERFGAAGRVLADVNARRRRVRKTRGKCSWAFHFVETNLAVFPPEASHGRAQESGRGSDTPLRHFILPVCVYCIGL